MSDEMDAKHEDHRTHPHLLRIRSDVSSGDAAGGSGGRGAALFDLVLLLLAPLLSRRRMVEPDAVEPDSAVAVVAGVTGGSSVDSLARGVEVAAAAAR